LPKIKFQVKLSQVGGAVFFQLASLAQVVPAQQSVHPTLGILARFQAVFYASAFSQADGVPPPAPARVTQTVGWTLAKQQF